MKQNDTILNVKNISIKYGRHSVLSDLSFKVSKGDYVGIIGPNGSGKSTLIKGILGLIPINCGTIVKDNISNIGYLPQKTYNNDKVFPATVKEIVLTGLLSSKRFPRFYNNNDHQKVENILKRLDIDHLKDNRIGMLSGGQQQRVMLARAIVNSPSILILDEPTSALDPKFREKFYKLINKLNKEDGITILHVSHDLSSVMEYTNKILHLDREILYYGEKEDYQDRSKKVRNKIKKQLEVVK